MFCKIIKEETITDTVAKLCEQACTRLPEDVLSALKKARERETSPVARNILDDIIKNAALAAEKNRPCCQDTGMAVVFLDIGNRVYLDCNIYAAINEGVRRAYCDKYFRKSTLMPITREKFDDNTPAVIHLNMFEGDSLRITVAPKGFGSENMSRVAMLTPSAGLDGVEDFIVDTVRSAGGNPCPPGIVGIGIGGTFDSVTTLAKRQLLRPIGVEHPNERIRDMEARLLERINALGIGPMGLGGNTTALAVHIGELPTHIAGLPVAVNMQCHAARHATAVI